MRIHITDTSSCITDFAIKNTLDNDRSTIFIVPEPSKAQIERSVIRSIIENKSHTSGDVKINGKTSVVAGFADGDVVSFIKLSGRVLDSLGIPHTSESDTVLRNAIYSVLAKHHSEFNTFADLTGRCENINRLISLLGDFARYNITVEEISKAIDASEGSKDSYTNKLSDIKLLMEYLNELSDTYSLNLLCDPILLAADDARRRAQRPVNFGDLSRAGRAVKAVDILRYDVDRFSEPRFKLRNREMARIRLRVAHNTVERREPAIEIFVIRVKVVD